MSELAVEDLWVEFGGGKAERIPVLRGVSLGVRSGESVALVGESGSGKSMLARAVLDLLPVGAAVTGGTIRLDEDTLGEAHGRRRSAAAWRGRRIGLMLQEPAGALNPVLAVRSQLVELLRLHRRCEGKAAAQAAEALLSSVGLAGDLAGVLAAFPHQLSGGQRQRVLLALALVAEPAFLLADEPTTALDVTVQKQVLDLLTAQRESLGLGVLLITHDLAVVAGRCSRIYVLYSGQVVEEGPVDEVFANPSHPYTNGLLATQPRVGLPSPRGRMPTIPGSVPSPRHRPEGCAFHPRCADATSGCASTEPPILQIDSRRTVRCHHPRFGRPT